MNQKEHEPKRARSKKSTNQKQHKPKTVQTKNSTNQKWHKPTGQESKTAGTKKGTNQKVVTCGKLQYFNQNTILLYLGIETQQMTAI